MAPNNSASTGAGVSVRADIAAIEVLTDAYDCIQQFMAMEGDPEDGPDLQAAQSVLDQIEALVEAEAQEPNEPAEMGMGAGMGMSSAAAEGVSRACAMPRENLVRTVVPGAELRALEDGSRTLAGHFAVFNQWTEISSMWEGNFMERIVPGAFRKTFRENAPSIKVLFNHGQDPSIGDKPLGPINNLAEDSVGAAYEVGLLDTSYVRELVPGLQAGLYGASFRFRVMREDIVEEPEPSPSNPRGLPERTIREAKVMEFGPVTFPAYEGATAGVRSQTDEFVMRRMLEQPEQLRALLTNFLPAETEEDGDAGEPPTDDSAEPEAHPAAVRRSTRPLFGMDKEEKPTWRL